MAVNTNVNKHTIIICANVLVKRDDKYLVIKRSPSKIIAPNIVHTVGGKVDENEDPYVAAQRELEEESGLVAQNMRLRGIATEVKPDGVPNWQIFYFLGDYKDGEVRDTEEGELLWLTKEEIFEADLFPSVKQIISQLLDETQGPVFARFLYDDEDQLIDGSFDTLSA